MRKNKKKAVKTVGRWSYEETKLFKKGVQLFGDNWDQVEEFVGTRSRK